MRRSWVRRLPAGFWVGLVAGLATALLLDAQFPDHGEAYGYAVLLAGFPAVFLATPLLTALPADALVRPSLVTLVALNAAGWGAWLHVIGRSIVRVVRDLHARP